MRLAVLTTETPHHAFFVRELLGRASDLVVFCETEPPRARYETSHRFEQTRDAYEWDLWFGAPTALARIAPTEFVVRMNHPEAVAKLAAFQADAAIVFGTGKLDASVIGACPGAILNLHGGDPERYRGLDTHLWAIWHRDFAGLVTTLHHVDAELDTGAIVKQARVPVKRGMQLHELRAANTQACLELTLAALAARNGTSRFGGTPQTRRGRYYSFMPSVLKEDCVAAFARYSERLA